VLISKTKIRRYLPPILIDCLKRLKQIIWYADWEYIKEGWNYQNPKLKGWNISDIAKLQLEKWPQFVKAIKSPSYFGINHEAHDYTEPDNFAHNLLVSFNYVCALAAHRSNTFRLLDWGGGIGHYGQIAKEALPDVKIQYDNYDLDVFELSFQQLFPEGKFSKSIDELTSRYDLINISSSLWYDPDWQHTLQKLAILAEGYIYIARMIFIKHNPSYVAIQRPYAEGYNTEYLCWILNETELIEYAKSLGFKLERKFYFSQAPHIYNAPEQGVFLGFLFKRN